MTKASKWAWAQSYRTRPACPYGEVTDGGWCEVYRPDADEKITLTPGHALILARWILDTFGEDNA